VALVIGVLLFISILFMWCSLALIISPIVLGAVTLLLKLDLSNPRTMIIAGLLSTLVPAMLLWLPALQFGNLGSSFGLIFVIVIPPCLGSVIAVRWATAGGADA
jgi:hypothetical protein